MDLTKAELMSLNRRDFIAATAATGTLISAPAVQFKGTGWYVTDYGGRKSSESSSSSKKSKSSSSGEIRIPDPRSGKSPSGPK